jgi:hypothetical protein
VPPHVRYGMIWLLIRDAVGSVPCSNEWEIGVVTHLGSHGATNLLSFSTRTQNTISVIIAMVTAA